MVHVQMANNHYKEINGNSGNEAFLQPPSSVPFSRFFLGEEAVVHRLWQR